MRSCRPSFLNNLKRVPAFNLLELSFVLLIMGVMLSVSLPFFASYLETERNRKTEEVFRQLTHSLANHVLQTGRLPCAAAANASEDTLGQEITSPCATQGIVPYKTLGISPALIRDGQGQYITYAVDPTFTQKRPLAPLQDASAPAQDNAFAPETPTTTTEDYCHVSSMTSLKVYDDHQKLIAEDPLKQPIFVLVSHGKQGGAFLENGSRKPPMSKSALKIENANNDDSFMDAPLTKDFDDRIFWRDRFSFLSSFGNFHCPPA